MRIRIVALALVVAPCLAAQGVRSEPPVVQSLLAMLRADNAWTLEQQRTLCEIPAPPFKETARALEYKKRFETLGLPARIDAIGNVLAERPGTGRGPTVVIAGHLDTVFPEETDVTVKVEGGRMSGPRDRGRLSRARGRAGGGARVSARQPTP
jgi:tripeptide aminopeptidase